MKHEVMKKWVDALRFGNYRQATGTLREVSDSGPAYCCLGVLCELHRQEHNADNADYHYTWGEGISQSLNKSAAYADQCDILPHSVRQWAGLHDRNPLVKVEIYSDEEDEGRYEITELNDEIGWSFEELAATIEKQWESL